MERPMFWPTPFRYGLAQDTRIWYGVVFILFGGVMLISVTTYSFKRESSVGSNPLDSRLIVYAFGVRVQAGWHTLLVCAYRLAGWQAGRLAGRLAGWQAGRLAGRLAGTRTRTCTHARMHICTYASTRACPDLCCARVFARVQTRARADRIPHLVPPAGSKGLEIMRCNTC